MVRKRSCPAVCMRKINQLTSTRTVYYAMYTYIPDLKLHPLSVYDNCSDFKVHTDGCDIRSAECVVGKPYEQ